MDSRNRSILITGAGSGIGLATALHLAGQGYRVYASVPTAAQHGEVEAAARHHGVKLKTLTLDVTYPDSVQTAVQQVVAESGGIYGLVSSAGLGLRGFFEDLSDQEIRRLFDVNVFGTMQVTRAVLPHMRTARRGRILIVTSAGGRIASLTISAYCASKFALEGFGESLSLEMAPFGVYVSLIEPGLVMTPHFTVNRGRAAAATNPASPYYAWFMQHEKMVDDMLQAKRILPADVAQVIGKALAAPRPRLRYVVGWRAALLIWLRRYLPDSLFQPVYTRRLTRIITQPHRPAAQLSQLSLPGSAPLDYLGLGPKGDNQTMQSSPINMDQIKQGMKQSRAEGRHE